MRTRPRRQRWTAVIAVVALALAAGGALYQHLDAETAGDMWLQSVHSEAPANFSSSPSPLPNSGARKVGVEIYSENNWQVFRSYPSGFLEVFRNKTGEPKRVGLSGGWRRDTHPMLIMSVADRLYVVGYDVVRNIPSGRSLTATQPGFDVYEIQPDTKSEPRVLSKGVDLGGGIDSIVYGRVRGSDIVLCAERACAEVDANGKVHPWSLEALDGYEFVEVSFDVDSAYALVRKTWDDRLDGHITKDRADYFLAELTSGKATRQRLAGKGIPFGLAVKDGRPSLKYAQDADDLQALLVYEIARMRHSGLIDFGANNLEGRVAWNQAYYLNGLISIGQGELAFSSPKLEDYARRRVSAEIELIAQLADEDYPGYRVKRYSLDREPVVFALHLGRVAELLARADRDGMGAPSVQGAMAKLRSELRTLEHTTEHLVDCRLPSTRDCKTLAYRQGHPFWADGVNVPYNYVSGYVSGMLALSDSEADIDLAIDLMRPLRRVEQFAKFPEVWRYWGFDGQSGWDYSSGGSLNTPEWAGNKAGLDIAHITYRSMDAMALLKLHQKRQGAVRDAEIAHFKDLVSRGMLLPSVNESLRLVGSPATLDPKVSKRFARSSQAWQIQSQVWALSELAQSHERKPH